VFDGKFSYHLSFWDEVPRKIMQISLGPVVMGLTPPIPDTRHGPSLLVGCQQRFCSRPPKADKLALFRLKRYVERFVVEHFVPLPPDADVSVDTWLKGTTYPEWRKSELMKVWNDSLGIAVDKAYENQGHGKVETYMKYKFHRGINSRSDWFKCFTGPYFKLIEKEVFKLPEFIKKIPVCERPAYLLDMLGKFPGPFAETDYTKFERHFVRPVMESLELVLCSHMLVNFPDVFREIKAALSGDNKCRYPQFSLKIDARRMSGDMCTSLGNGFSNLMLAKFICFEAGCDIVGVVEGDDGLFYSQHVMSEAEFARLGFEIKMMYHDDVLRTQFCGLSMSDDLVSMTDPRKVLVNFGWTHSPLMWGGERVRLGLLRAKALSLLYEHPRCPVLSSLAKRYIVLTEGVRPRWESNWYEQHLVHEVLSYADRTDGEWKKGPSIESRIEFDRLYHISIDEQLHLEDYLSKAPIGVLDDPVLLSLYNDGGFVDLRDYHARYVRTSIQDFLLGGFKAVLLLVVLTLLALLMSWVNPTPIFFQSPGQGSHHGGNPGPKRLCVLTKMPRDCTDPYAMMMHSPVCRLHSLHGCRSANLLTTMSRSQRRKDIGQAILEKNLSADGRDWLTLAVDPFHDLLHPIAGYPDADSSHTVVSCYQYSLDISKPPAAAGNWDLHIMTNPWSGFIAPNQHTSLDTNWQFAKTAGASGCPLDTVTAVLLTLVNSHFRARQQYGHQQILI